MIIGLCGSIGAGKTTAALHLVKYFGFARVRMLPFSRLGDVLAVVVLGSAFPIVATRELGLRVLRRHVASGRLGGRGDGHDLLAAAAGERDDAQRHGDGNHASHALEAIAINERGYSSTPAEAPLFVLCSPCGGVSGVHLVPGGLHARTRTHPGDGVVTGGTDEDVDHATALAVEKAIQEDRTIRWMEQVDKTLEAVGRKVDITNGRVTKLEAYWSFARGAAAVFIFGGPILVGILALVFN